MKLDVNVPELMKLIKSFHKLTHMRIVFFDSNFVETFAYPPEYAKFCEETNKIPGFRKKCDKSNEILCNRCKKFNSLVVGTCHAGLIEVVAPLTKDGETMGYIMFGQIRNIKDNEKFFKQVETALESYKIDSQKLSELTKSVPYKTNDQIEAAAQIVNVFISYIYFKGIVDIKKEGTAYMIMSYIEENLEKTLTVSEISQKFFISRTKFYEMTKPYMKKGIAAFVRERRIEKAKSLLLSTDKSVEEISSLTGFNDYNYFRRVFKKYTGVPANKFRKTAKKP